jgi:hypothetical protein
MDVITSELIAEQHVVDDLLIHLAHAVVSGPEQAVGPTWRELERRIFSLLAVEQLLLLPLLDPEQEEAATSTRAAHRLIRSLASELAVGVGLRNVRVASIEKLRSALREHAQHEAGALYRYAWERTSVAAQYRLAAALRGAARIAHHSEPPPPVSRSTPPTAQSDAAVAPAEPAAAAPHLAELAVLARAT